MAFLSYREVVVVDFDRRANEVTQKKYPSHKSDDEANNR